MTTAVSQKRIDANRRNAKKSTGPRTPEGKSHSRFNRLQHGLAAKVTVLPGEDPAAFQTRVNAIVETFAPQNQVELELLERVAATTWSLDRATRAETARLRHNIRHEAIEREQREKAEAVALGQRLLWDARGPWQNYPHDGFMGLSTHSRISWSKNPADPHTPALLVLGLERTVAGCRWLLDRWAELRARLEPGEAWAASDQFKAIRLLGKQPLDAVDDPEVIQIFLASVKLLPDGADTKPFAPLKSELQDGGSEYGIYAKELRKRQLSNLTPPDAEFARETLKVLVDRHTSRLKLILARNHEIAEADAAEAPDRLAFDPSPEGEKLRRYVLSAARLVNQTIKTYLSVVPGPLSVVNQDSTAVLEQGDGGDFDEHPRTEANLEISVVSGPLSVVNQDSQAGGEPSEKRGSDAIPRTEANLDISVVSGPLSVVNQDSQAGGEPSAKRGPDTIPRTEANLEIPVVSGPLSVVNRESYAGAEPSAKPRFRRDSADRSQLGYIRGQWSVVRC